MENKYENGIIYKLCCRDTTITDVYVGSTCRFNKRKNNHKSSCNNEKSKAYNFYLYQFIRENGGWDNWDMIELIKYPCETKAELELKEREYLELLSATLNKFVPTRSKREYKLANKEHLNEKDKAYRLANKERKKAYHQATKERTNKKRREIFNCECGGNLTKSGKSKHLKTIKHQKYLNCLNI